MTLGLTPSAENGPTIRFSMPNGSWFQVYETAFAGTGKHTVAQWEVGDLAASVAELTERGVSFERYDMPGVTWDGPIAEADGMRVAWFTDSEGNVMCLDERPAG